MEGIDSSILQLYYKWYSQTTQLYQVALGREDKWTTIGQMTTNTCTREPSQANVDSTITDISNYISSTVAEVTD